MTKKQQRKSPLRIFEVRSENLTACGGRMGTEHTWDNWRRYFRKLEKAQATAEKDYGNSIPWQRHTSRTQTFSSVDLGHVMYHVTPVRIE
jgi:hypothetical protein